jgi:hypothetical protein
MKPGGRSRRPAPLLPSTVPFTVAEKVSTTTAGRELWGQGTSQMHKWPCREGQGCKEGREGICTGCQTSLSQAPGGSHGLYQPRMRSTGEPPRGSRGQTAGRQADRQRETKARLGPCHLTEAASLAALSPGSWAPAAGWVPPATSEASAGCNTKASKRSSRHRTGHCGQATRNWPLQ